MDSARPADSNRNSDETLIDVPGSHRVLIVAGLTVLGIGLGIAAPHLIRWAHGVDWLPFQGPMRLLEMLAGRVGSWLLVVIGGVAGAVIGLGITDDLTKVRITDRDVTFIKGRKKERFARAQVTAAMIDEGHLVLRDQQDADLIRHDLDVPADRVRQALRTHDWPMES
jgi:hypothetical protein